LNTLLLIDLFQDKTVLSYIAYVLEVPDLDVVNLALDILEIFVKNVDNYIHITSTFGVRESLEGIINKYSLNEPKIAGRAQHVKDDIERMKPPIYNLRSRCRRVIEPKKLKTHVIVLHVQGLLPVSNSTNCIYFIKIMRFAGFLCVQIHSWNANIS